MSSNVGVTAKNINCMKRFFRKPLARGKNCQRQSWPAQQKKQQSECTTGSSRRHGMRKFSSVQLLMIRCTMKFFHLMVGVFLLCQVPLLGNIIGKVQEDVFLSIREKDKVTPSSMTDVANGLLKTRGVILRVTGSVQEPKSQPKMNENGREYLPASFLHAAMHAPNVLVKLTQAHLPKVAILIGTKFEPNHHNNDQDPLTKVDCRAYYPCDAHSNLINRTILNNPLGTSCHRNQPNLTVDEKAFYNVSNSCSCNIDTFDGSDYGRLFIYNHIRKQNICHVGKFVCWYPGTTRGIQNMIAASNSLYYHRKKIIKHSVTPLDYCGWTECSASPNMQDRDMIDALVIELPLSAKREGNDNSHFEDLDNPSLMNLQTSLMEHAHHQFPVLLLKEKRVMNKTECLELWGGEGCEDGYRKEFISPPDIVFSDGSCLSKVNGDEEVRYYLNNSGLCAGKCKNKTINSIDPSTGCWSK